MHCRDPGVTAKSVTFSVSMQPMPCHEHGGREPSVIHLHPRDGVLHHDPAPLPDRWLRRLAKAPCLPQITRTSRSASATVNPKPLRATGRSSRSTSFRNVLVGVVQEVAPFPRQLGEGGINQFCVADRNLERRGGRNSCRLNTRRWPSSRGPDRSSPREMVSAAAESCSETAPQRVGARHESVGVRDCPPPAGARSPAGPELFDIRFHRHAARLCLRGPVRREHSP